MLPCLFTIHKDLSFLIHTLEVELHHLADGRFECLAIFALASLEPSAASSRSPMARIGSFEDVPVVRQVNGLRFPIMRKLPAEVKQLP